ncbi:MAG TPA: chemotaxis protein CheA, partial [bacterium]|nr:chemotaxis protein CheA [bacterium]
LLHEPEVVDEQQGLSIIERMKTLSQAAEGTDQETEDETTPEEAAPGEGDLVCYRIRFQPNQNIFLSGTNPLLLLDELKGLGECTIVADTSAIPTLEEINPELCYTSWDIVLTTVKGLNAIKDVFIFVEDDSKITIDIIQESKTFDAGPEARRLGEILLDKGDIDREKLQQILNEKKLLGDILVDAGLVTNEKVEAALAEQKQIKATRERRLKAETASSIRVRSDKLDTLVDLVGELVTVQARLSQSSAKESGNTDLVAISETVERLTAELRDNAMSLRMVPIGTTFSRFRRLVRDLSNQLGKKIELTTEGAETELDKTVIERLNDPLVHLIRNCIDHGIEIPETRASKGKPETGTIHLKSSHSGAHVLIQIIDDGAGLDLERIRAKAIERKLIEASAELAEREVYQLIFAPGFSTAQVVTDVSGRGVGMDVAKRTIDNLGGAIEIDSRPGQGTTITLKIPLTLAIIEGLLIKIGEDCFVVPLSTVEQCVELTRADVEASHGRNIINLRGEVLPYIKLRETFNIAGDRPAIEQIVVTRTENQPVGFVVDEVIGQIQTVIKTLGKMYQNIDGVSGATILGDGTVALILDVLKLKSVAELDDA